jgi:hypothetical protein
MGWLTMKTSPSRGLVKEEVEQFLTRDLGVEFAQRCHKSVKRCLLRDLPAIDQMSADIGNRGTCCFGKCLTVGFA